MRGKKRLKPEVADAVTGSGAGAGMGGVLPERYSIARAEKTKKAILARNIGAGPKRGDVK